VGDVMRNPLIVLETLSEKSKDSSYKYERLYRNLYNPEFYYLAYQNIYANKGSMTPGSDNQTIDGMVRPDRSSLKVVYGTTAQDSVQGNSLNLMEKSKKGQKHSVKRVSHPKDIRCD